MIFDYLEEHYLDHIVLIFYILNFIFAVIAFKLGFARKLSPMKTLIIYILLAIGNIILTMFSLLKMPITESLIIVSIVMGIYRLRLHNERKKKKTAGQAEE